MRKNKKLFAILTLVAFMMTLVPALAFAAGETLTVASPTKAASTTAGAPLTAGTVTCSGAGHTVTANAYQWTKDGADIPSAAASTYTATEVGAYNVKIGGVCAGSGCAQATFTGAIAGSGITVDASDITAANKLISVTSAVGVTDVKDTQADIKVTLKLASAAIGDAAYTIKFDGTAQTDTITVAKGSKTANKTYAVAKTATEQTIVVTVEFDNTPAVGTTPQNAVIPASSSSTTSAAWAAYKDAPSDGTKFTAFKNAQATSPLTGADADKAAVIAECSIVGSAQAYFVADAAYTNLKANITTTTLAAFKNALDAVDTDKLAKFTSVSEATLKAIKGTSNLEEVADLINGGSTGGGTLPITPGVGAPSIGASLFGAEDNNPSVDSNSTYKKNGFDNDKKINLNILMKDAGQATVTPSAPQNVYIWAEVANKANEPSDALILADANGVITTKAINNASVYKITASASLTTVKANFLRGGNYILKASFNDPTNADGLIKANMATIGGSVTEKQKVTVTSAAPDTRNYFISAKYKTDGQADTDYVTVNGPSNGYIYDGNTSGSSIKIAANTVNTTKVALHVYNAQGNDVTNYPVKLSTNSANIELSQTTATTGLDGVATFNVAGLREGTYKIYVAIGDYESIVTVQVGATSANSIETIKFPSNPIATDTDVDDYKNIFRFQLSDANGNIVAAKGELTEGAEKATAGYNGTSIGDEAAKYVQIISAPEANKVKNSELYLVLAVDNNNESKDYYTFGMKNGKKFEAEGDYVVRVVLDNGKSVEVPFTIKKFDKAVSLSIEYPTESVELNAATDTPDIYFLDANNVMKKANNRVTVAAQGYAVADIEQNGKEAGALKVKNDEKYVGSTITVTAVAEKENLSASTTLTVSDSAQTVKLDTNRGQVNAANRIGFKLVNSNGQTVALGSDTNIDDVTCIVTNVGDPDAKVSFSVAGTTKSDLKNNGTGVVTLTSNKETTANVQIMIKVSKKTQSNDNNTGLSTTYYTGNETFTFGAEADKSVVMTIGSKELVANNVPVATDVAPFIKDNRTWVPFRALTEAFGAEVEYNAENNTVTTKLNGKTVVLTVGSNVLTVNDEAVTMDVAPYIVDDRVVVPVRFVGEAFGFTVEATQDAAGATASVVFYQK